MTYRERFPNRAVFPVIHARDYDQVARNLEIVRDCAADGVLLIYHDQPPTANWLDDPFLKLIHQLQGAGWHDELWIGANFLVLPYQRGFETAYRLGLDGVWADTVHALDPAALSPATVTTNYGRPFPLSFGGVAFKHQHQQGDGTEEARRATGLTDVVTTSGDATGLPASIEKLARLREAVGDHPLATASGVTPDNAAEQFRFVDAVLVATGINREGDFHNIEPERLERVIDIARSCQPL